MMNQPVPSDITRTRTSTQHPIFLLLNSEVLKNVGNVIKFKVLMKQIFILFSLLLLIFSGCDKRIPMPKEDWQNICGRAKGIEIYRAKVPAEWLRNEPEVVSDDTTRSICEFSINDQDGNIRITIHNFPSDTMEKRIPPMMQVSRWKRQFEEIDNSSFNLGAESHGGFAGLNFQATGIMKGQRTTVLAWIMQMAPEHYRNLSYPKTGEQTTSFAQMRSDYSIKAVGNPVSVEKHKNAITSFAKSFELIKEIPTRS